MKEQTPMTRSMTESINMGINGFLKEYECYIKCRENLKVQEQMLKKLANDLVMLYVTCPMIDLNLQEYENYLKVEKALNQFEKEDDKAEKEVCLENSALPKP